MIAKFTIKDCLNNLKEYEVKNVGNVFIKNDYIIINYNGAFQEFCLCKVIDFNLKGEEDEK